MSVFCETSGMPIRVRVRRRHPSETLLPRPVLTPHGYMSLTRVSAIGIALAEVAAGRVP